MRIAYLSTEVYPFARTGGLGDVAGALPKSLAILGHDPIVLMPYFRTVQSGNWPIEPTGHNVSVPFDGLSIDGSILRSVLPDSNVPIYFIACDQFFDRDGLYNYRSSDYGDNIQRFAFFCRAALEALKVLNWVPDLVHANDWQTSLAPIYLKTVYQDDPFFSATHSLLTLHNLAYQGIFPIDAFAHTGLPDTLAGEDGLGYYDQFSLLKGGIRFADRINAVSETYAREIQTDEYGSGMASELARRANDLSGILNGIDTSIWNPSTDPLIAHHFSADALGGKLQCKRALQHKAGLMQIDVPLIGIIARLTHQKGLDLLEPIIRDLMKYEFQLVLLGNGEARLEAFFTSLQETYNSRISVQIGFDNRYAHEIEAGSDLFLMPSRYEPCGLNQMYSLTYGTVPVVRRTGGLADTVADYSPEGLASGQANGFVFDRFDSTSLLDTLARAFELYHDKPNWTRLIQNGMRCDFSWHASANQYAALYKDLTAERLRSHLSQAGLARGNLSRYMG